MASSLQVSCSRSLLSILLITTTCFLYHLSQVGHASCSLQTRHRIDVGLEATDYEYDNDGEDEIQHDSKLASRGHGGQNMTADKDVFPWFHILYTNPADEFLRYLDGYVTGYAITVEHNVVLAHNDVIKRASIYHKDKLVLQGWRNLASLFSIDPYGDREWEHPKGGYDRGVVKLLAELGPSFGLYRVQQEKYPYVTSGQSRSRSGFQSRLDTEDGLPPFDYPLGKNANAWRYPIINKDKELKENCYVYAMSAPDYGEGTRFNERDKRWFSRWPVKVTQCIGGSCRFEFDERRAKGIIRKGWLCNTWQDVGAPIMCAKDVHGYDPASEYFQRRYLRLSYLVRPERPFNNKVRCTMKIVGIRLANFADVIEDAIDKLRKSDEL